MSLVLVDSLSLPGDPAKANEDAFGYRADAALVLDGATPLGPSLLPGPSDAAWIAQFGARRLLAHLAEGDMPREALRRALEDSQKSFTGLSRTPIREKWQTPCASMMLVAETADGAEFLWFGDCSGVIARPGQAAELVGDATASRRREAARAAKHARACSPTKTNAALPDGIVRRETAQPLLRAGRNRINSGSYWLFSPEPRAADHAGRALHALVPGTLLLLASDGLMALVTDYGAYDPDALVAAARDKGLAALGRELRALEAADAEGTKYPRFKKHDDATGLLLEVA